MKKKGDAHMEEKPKVKAKRKWTLVLIFILILGTIAAILAINRPIHSKKIREKKKAEVQIDTSQFTADSLQGLTASVSNLEAVKGYHPDASLNQITHDTNVIKKLEADISKVDFDTPGTYDITYNVTVYCKALKAYIDQKPRIDIQKASNGQIYKIPLKGKIQVVEKEQALKDSASGRYIYGLQMQMRQE